MKLALVLVSVGVSALLVELQVVQIVVGQRRW